MNFCDFPELPNRRTDPFGSEVPFLLNLRYTSHRESIGHELREKNMSIRGSRRFAGGESGKNISYSIHPSFEPAAAHETKKRKPPLFQIEFSFGFG